MPLKNRFFNRLAVPIGLCMAIGYAQAEWTLNNADSALFYLTTKNVNITELNTFNRLSGGIDAEGHASITIDLSSVDTAIEIRDDRMREMFFHTEQFPSASIQARIDPADLADIQPGDRKVLNPITLQLTLGETTRDITSGMVVVGLHNGIQVSNLQPIVVVADHFGLAAGVEALRAIVSLENITNNAPVNFTLVFDQVAAAE